MCRPNYQKDVTISRIWPYVLKAFYDLTHSYFSSSLYCFCSALFTHRAMVGFQWLSESQGINM